MRLFILAVCPLLACSAAELRIGIVGLDSSHGVQFTQLLNDATRPERIPGGRVVAAFKGGSPDVPASANRIEKFTAEVTSRWQVELVDSIPELCRRVDAVLLLSVDGRKHLEQVRPVLAAKRPVYIDKPLAGSLRDAREIARLSRESGTPFFSSSSQRYSSAILNLKANSKIGSLVGAITWGPAPIEPYLPDLFWYGIHSIEALYALMGPGCETVARTYTPAADLLVGRWRDGRIGTVRGIREGEKTYGAVAFGSQAIAAPAASREGGESRSNYVNLVGEIVKFFQTGRWPVPVEETLEIFAFMEAAEMSKSRQGAAVELEEAMRAASR
jgi:predicted dehydrogenase